MTQAFYIAPVAALHPDIAALAATARAEGFHFVDKLMKEWITEKNRFDRPGELFVAAFEDEHVIGFCGLNRDPYENRNEIARLRHLYIRQDARRKGVGSALLHVMLDAADGSFSIIRLRTNTQEAAAFYARHGFIITDSATSTHSKALRAIAQDF